MENSLLSHCQNPPQTQYSSLNELQGIIDTEREFANKIQQIAFSELSTADSDLIKTRFLGKTSPLTTLLKSLKNLPGADRKPAGALINEFKKELESEFEGFFKGFQLHCEEQKLQSEQVDLTLPLPPTQTGSRHPISVTLRDLLLPFEKMGFSVVDGPEIDSDFYNFETLNVLKDHPAREMQDTFFVAAEWVLRTHTSNVQSHAMLERGVPLKIVCPGYVYRNEYDMTHSPTFRQIECLVVDKGIHMGHLRHLINELLNDAFGRKVKIRLRSSYFPFTEPSAEVDVECQQCFRKGCRSCKHTGWSEIGGCGVVNRKVLENCGIDSKIYSGIAFGFGVDRLAKDRYAVSDLRFLYDAYLPYLKSFRLK